MGKLYLIKLIKKYGYEGIKIYRRLTNPNTIQISIPSYKSNFYLRKNTKDKDIFKHIILEGDYDIKFDFKPEIIIDAGAYTGFSSVFFANKYPNSKVFAIEVDNDNFKTLQKNSKPYKNIFSFNNALWYNNTKLKINNVGVNKCSITVNEEFSNEGVQTITINDIIDKYYLDKIDLLKIDIEGAEKELFENNPHSWLSKTKVLIIELHDRKKVGCSKAVFEAMLKYNFSTEVKSEYIIFKLHE